MSDIMKPKKKTREERAFRVRSLNDALRRKEMQKIMDENQMILKRLQARKPYYSRQDWVKHSAQHTKNLENLRDRPFEEVALKLRRKQKGISSHNKRHSLKPLNTAERKGNEALKASAGAGDENVFSKRGHNIDGQHVMVTVDEHKEPHALFIRTYNLADTSVQSVKVTFDFMKQNFAEDNLSYADDKREELANFLLRKLRFKDGNLVIDPSAASPKAKKSTPGKKAVKKSASKKSVTPASTDKKTAAPAPAASDKKTTSATATPAAAKTPKESKTATPASVASPSSKKSDKDEDSFDEGE